MSESTRTVTRAPRQVRRAQILEAALRCFAEHGYHEASMDDLVRASGLSKGSLYWHFDSKQDVLLALFDAFCDEIFSAWAGADDGQRPVLDVLERGGELAVGGLAADRALLRAWVEFFAHPVARERMAEVYRQSRTRVAALLARGIERGELRAHAPDATASALIGLIEGVLLQASVDPDFDPAACWPDAFQLMRRGLHP